ncbi:stress protein [Viridibacillus sp. NPDC093762]|uniref:stress protein n=1 Tax=Viridibacillus sp. NPDC093762 TaxID=3390720 RepID=UPI003CFCB271
MKKQIFLSLIAVTLILTPFANVEAKANKGDATVITLAAKAKKVTTNSILKGFKSDGLEVGKVSKLNNREFGNLRKDGKRVLIPSLGKDNGGRLYEFKNKKDLKRVKSYYDELGNGGPMFYSHTHQRGLFLLQMNGDMSDKDFAKYVKSMNAAIKK